MYNFESGINMREAGETLLAVASNFDTFVLLEDFITWSFQNSDAISLLDVDLRDRIILTIGDNYQWVDRNELDFLIVDNFGRA